MFKRSNVYTGSLKYSDLQPRYCALVKRHHRWLFSYLGITGGTTWAAASNQRWHYWIYQSLKATLTPPIWKPAVIHYRWELGPILKLPCWRAYQQAATSRRVPPVWAQGFVLLKGDFPGSESGDNHDWNRSWRGGWGTQQISMRSDLRWAHRSQEEPPGVGHDPGQDKWMKELNKWKETKRFNFSSPCETADCIL